MTEANKNSANTPTSTTVNNEQKTHHNRHKPRRNGKGSNVQTNQAIAQKKSVDATAQIDEALLEQADEAAIAEGGVKAIGDKRIINFMKIEKLMVIISGLLVLIALGAIFVKGLNLGLDFTGGVSADVKYAQPVEQTVVVQALEDNGFADSVVQYLGTRQELLVRLPPQDVDAEGLTERLNNALDINGNNADIESINIIGSQVGNEVYLNSLMAIGLALACMLVYVAVRFQFKLSIGAVLALFHDAIITIGVFALFGWPFDLTVLAAVLALIGYSLNDTIVVYDRIRENFRRIRGVGPRQVINVSLTETLRRTFMTSMTVLLVIWAMMFLGGDGLFWFSVALFIGMVAGTYSSVYIASAIPLMMGLSRDDFVVKVKPEFAEEVVSFNDPKAEN